MRREEINQYMRLVPGYAKQYYGLREFPDLSGKQYRIIRHKEKEYRYYPDIPGVLVGEKLVIWETGGDDVCEIDVRNPIHMEEIIKRGGRLQYDRITGFVYVSRTGKISLRITDVDSPTKPYDANRTRFITVDDTKIFYNPEDIDLESNGPKKVIVKALFLAKRYNREYIIPYKDVKPDEWGMYD